MRWIAYQRARGVRSLTLESYEGGIRREIAPVSLAFAPPELELRLATVAWLPAELLRESDMSRPGLSDILVDRYGWWPMPM